MELLIGLRGGEEARRAQKVRAAELGGSLNHWNVWGAARGGPHRADRGQQDRRGGQGEGEAAADHSLYYQCALCAADFLQTKALQLVFWWFNGIAQLDQAPASAAAESWVVVYGRILLIPNLDSPTNQSITQRVCRFGLTSYLKELLYESRP